MSNTNVSPPFKPCSGPKVSMCAFETSGLPCALNTGVIRKGTPLFVAVQTRPSPASASEKISPIKIGKLPTNCQPLAFELSLVNNVIPELVPTYIKDGYFLEMRIDVAFRLLPTDGCTKMVLSFLIMNK